MQWTRVVLPNEIKPLLPRWWFYPISLISAFLIFGLLTYFINDSLSSLNDSILLLGMLLPAILCGLAIIAFSIHIYITRLDEYHYRLTFIEAKKREWQYWGRSAMPICAYAQYTPIENVTDKILGISGDIPLNPNVILSFNDVPVDKFNQYSLSFVLNKLIEPMFEKIKPIQHKLKIHFYSSETERITQTSLQQTFEWFKIRNVSDENIHYLSEIPGFQTVYSLLEDEPLSSHLVIMISLNNNSSSNKTEGSVGLLFNAPLDDVENEVYLFRPLEIGKSQISQRMEEYLEVEQTEGDENIHLWMTNVDVQSTHVLTEVIGNSNCNYTIAGIHSMNVCFGDVSSIYAWNSVVCAAETIKTKGENSLAILQNNGDIESIQLAKTPAKMPDDNFYHMSGVHMYYLIGLTLFSLGIILFITSYSELTSFMPWVGGIAVIMFILSIISVPIHQNQLRKKCQREWGDAEKYSNNEY